MKKALAIIIFITNFCVYANSAVPTTQKIRIDNNNWLFLKSDLGSIWEAVRPAQKEDVPIWSKVNLPHCVNAFDAVDPDLNYYQGPMWYKTQLELNNPYKNGRIVLEFEGAGQKSEVYIYMTKVGEHVGGYDEWSVDITDAVAEFMKHPDAKRFAGKVPLSIRCDNSRDTEMVPSDLSDFNVYGGLYRHLNLIYLPAVSFDNIHLDARVDKDGKQGVLKIFTRMYNPTKNSSPVQAKLTIKDPNGNIVADQMVTINPGDASKAIFEKTFNKPMLWDVNSPKLYTCTLSLPSEPKALTAIDRFGFRHTEFIENGPFMLNGKRLLLKGTHRHEDHAGLAAALTDSITISEMHMIKDMGVNFIRLGHYQQSDLVLRLCDQLGILVWEESPWCRGGLGGEVYQKQAKRMLTNLIEQHRNHPSVLVWGMGNENDWPGDFPEFDQQKIRAFMKEMHELSHSLDNTRMTAIRRCEFCQDIVDVYSPSIWPGWYKGRYTDYKNVMFNQINSTKRLLHVEWGGDSHAGRFSEDPYTEIDKVDYGVKFIDKYDPKAPVPYTGKINVPNKGDWSESYICDLFDWVLKEQETMPWITGAANWTFKDFSTPLRPENPVPYVNQKGLITRDQTPKESYYVFQSYWAEKPMLRIFGHDWKVRWGEPGEQKQIRVYSNCEQVELILNGVSLGMKKRNSQDYPAAGLRWDTPLKEGVNTVKAIAYKTVGKKLEAQCEDAFSFEYQTQKWGQEAQIDASIVEQGDGYFWVEAIVKDAAGVRCLDSDKYIDFEYSGDGKMIYNMGTPNGSRRLQMLNGRARIKVEMPKGGVGVLAVKSEGIPTTLVNLKK